MTPATFLCFVFPSYIKIRQWSSWMFWQSSNLFTFISYNWFDRATHIVSNCKIDISVPNLIQWYTVPFTYSLLPAWRWTFVVETTCQIKNIITTICADIIYLSYAVIPFYVPVYKKYKQQLTTDATKYGQPPIQRHCSFNAICVGVSRVRLNRNNAKQRISVQRFPWALREDDAISGFHSCHISSA